MGKGLKCADCGREFRGERRRLCSDYILTLLHKKISQSRPIASGHIHESCSIKLHKEFKGLEPGQPEVSTKSILLKSVYLDLY
jgi:hypothetical protein